MNKILLILFVIISFKATAFGSTYVGNGGSLLDNDLRRTILRFQSALNSSEIVSDDKLCSCSDRSPQCFIISHLENEQKTYCQDFIRRHNTQLLEVLSQKRVQFKWSAEPIYVEGSSRRFDALASVQDNLIIIDETRFTKIDERERVQLIAHEFLHFVKVDNKYLTDEGAIGPFTQQDGKRTLIDVASAHYVIMNQGQYATQKQVGEISDPYSKYYLSYRKGPKQANATRYYGENTSNSFSVQPSTTLQIARFTNPIDTVGYTLGYSSRHVATHVLNIGGVHRWSPIESQYAWLNSLQIWSELKIGLVRASTTKLSNPEAKEMKSLADLEADVSLQIPLIMNLWLSVGLSRTYYSSPLDYYDQKFHLPHTTTEFGVSYSVSP